MALILSIPIRSKASTQISAWTDFTRSYEGNTYDFHVYSTQASGLPQNYSFNSDVIDFVISKSGDAYNHTIYDSGIYVADWVINTGMDVAQGVLSLFANAYIAYNSAMQDYVYRDWLGVYLWEFEFTGSDDNYVGSADYGTAYGFTFHGLCGDKIDLVLDSSGDFYGQNRLGNWTYGNQTPDYIPHIINQADPDNIYIPSISGDTFSDLTPPYLDGKSLHFFIYENGNRHEVVVPDFTRTVITFPPFEPVYFGILIANLDNQSRQNIYIDNVQYSLSGQSVYYAASLHYCYDRYLTGWRFNFDNVVDTSLSDISISYPTYYNFNWNNNRVYMYNPNALGLLNGVQQTGTGDIWLDAASYTPVTPSTEPIPVDVPIPVEQIPSDPDEPLPNNPDPDPVPGITYPVNPTPPPLRPLPSIVSGNDDLWPSVVELQNIEIDLSGYLASLGDFEFPDLNTITESFAGSIIWVSALMSTLFNGSDFSILFAVLSSFFIVAALLGLYKWWNHK